MKKLFLILCMFCMPVFALVSPAEVEQECVNQMAAGICTVPIDRAAVAPGQTMIISGVGRVSLSAMADYTDLYNPIVPQDPAMCHLAFYKMTAEPGGDHDKIARAKWTPLPKAGPPPVSAQALAAAAIAAAMVVGAAAFMGLRKRPGMAEV